MEYNDFVKNVKRINERINDIYKNIGDSSLYRDIESIINSNPNINYNPNRTTGAIQLSRSRNNYELLKDTNIINRLLNKPTFGELKRKARESLKAQQKSKINKEDILQEIKDRDYVIEHMGDFLQAYYNYENVTSQSFDINKIYDTSYHDIRREMLNVFDKVENYNITPRDVFKDL